MSLSENLAQRARVRTVVSSIGSSVLLETYCIAEGLVDATEGGGPSNNGRICFVVSEAEGSLAVDDSSRRYNVLFVDDCFAPVRHSTAAADATAKAIGSSTAKLVTIKAANLVPIYNIEVRDSSLGGKGLFALKNFAVGEVIFEEKPLAIAASFDMVNKEVALLTDGERSALAGLTLCQDKSFPYMGSEWARRFANNCIMCGGGGSGVATAPLPSSEVDASGVIVPETAPSAYMALFPIMCRINHACFMLPSRHNVQWAWDHSRGAQYLTATRAIKAGEELLTDYITDGVWDEDRVMNLKVHGITKCECVACKPSMVALRRMQQYTRAKKILATAYSSAAATAAASGSKKKVAMGEGNAEDITTAAIGLFKTAEEGVAALEALEKMAMASVPAVADGEEKPDIVVSPLANLKSFLFYNVYQQLLVIRKKKREAMQAAEIKKGGSADEEAPVSEADNEALVVLTFQMREAVFHMHNIRLAAAGGEGNSDHPMLHISKVLLASLY